MLRSVLFPNLSSYDVDSDPAKETRAGPGNTWIVRPAKRKQSTSPSAPSPSVFLPVSVFIFERPLSEAVEKTFGGALQSIGVGRASSAAAGDKKVPEGVLEAMRRDAHQLAKLKHPAMLDVVEGLGEYRMGMAFGTESVQTTVGNILRRKFLSTEAASYELDDLEIQKGLLTIAKGLEFLQKAKIVHGNLTPHAIFLTAKGEWKIAGFNYSSQLSSDVSSGKPSEWHAESRLDSNEVIDKPNLDFVAPEVLLDEQCGYSSDMFSFGCLIYALYHEGRSPVQSQGSVRSWKQQVQGIDRTDLSKLPGPLQQCVARMLTRSPRRISPSEFMDSGYFQNLLISTLQFLEDFISKSQLHKAQFLKGLVKVMPSFSKKMQMTKILNHLLNELKDPAMVPYVLPNVFQICEHMSHPDFQAKVMPLLRPVLSTREPVQIPVVLLSRLDLLKKLLSPPDIVTILYSALEHPVLMVQNQALKVIPDILDALDYNTVKNSLFPRISHLFTTTTNVAIKTQCLVTISTFVAQLDKFAVSTKLLPLLRDNRVREPGIIMASLPLYIECGKIVDKEIIATEVIPELWKLAIDPVLEIAQFKGFMSLIKELTSKVEDTHLKQLEEMRGPEMTGYGANVQAAGLEMPVVNLNPTNEDIKNFESLLQLLPGNGVAVRIASVIPSDLPQTAFPPAFNVGSTQPNGFGTSTASALPQPPKLELLSSPMMNGNTSPSMGSLISTSFTPPPSIHPSGTNSGSLSSVPTFTANFSPPPQTSTSSVSTFGGMKFDMSSGMGLQSRPAVSPPSYISTPNYTPYGDTAGSSAMGSILSGPGRPPAFGSSAPTPFYSSTPNYGISPLNSAQRPPISSAGQTLLGLGAAAPGGGMGAGFGWSPQGTQPGGAPPGSGSGFMQPLQPMHARPATGESARSGLNQFDPFA
ncbi:hypothetical protein M427DRAFT_401402 [Gonapodya prolifera JEL478]|uniref:Protein kinase domain-containing protein n=1 Tax=Gonapodya prolifera (strain JEL478) TaxID=1344416 RepID=A0A139ATK9_GONPJ|nr:hypothetical protein M427DRAFT_401402 [Gonapodya prolifera JEL478]|eukprot:KXS20070.1 hypothetical protein M427DRAFT_401402 [Gonapodya prolifera JEL478]